jgi:aryl carrier-like protein
MQNHYKMGGFVFDFATLEEMTFSQWDTIFADGPGILNSFLMVCLKVYPDSRKYLLIEKLLDSSPANYHQLIAHILLSKVPNLISQPILRVRMMDFLRNQIRNHTSVSFNTLAFEFVYDYVLHEQDSGNLLQYLEPFFHFLVQHKSNQLVPLQ